MSKLKPCPFCGCRAPKMYNDCFLWYVECPQCRVIGPDAQTEAVAVVSWNARPGEEKDDGDSPDAERGQDSE